MDWLIVPIAFIILLAVLYIFGIRDTRRQSSDYRSSSSRVGDSGDFYYSDGGSCNSNDGGGGSCD